MKLLLDTHAFLWWDSNPAQLSAPVLVAQIRCSATLRKTRMSRDFWIVLIVSVAATLLLFAVWYPYTNYLYTSGGRQRYNMAVAEKELPRVKAILDADKRFKEVKVYVYTGQDGAIGLTGTVAKDDDLFRLMKAVAAEHFPIAVSWQVNVRDKNDEK